jgi:hypothetical protein
MITKLFDGGAWYFKIFYDVENTEAFRVKLNKNILFLFGKTKQKSNQIKKLKISCQAKKRLSIESKSDFLPASLCVMKQLQENFL